MFERALLISNYYILSPSLSLCRLQIRLIFGNGTLELWVNNGEPSDGLGNVSDVLEACQKLGLQALLPIKRGGLLVHWHL